MVLSVVGFISKGETVDLEFRSKFCDSFTGLRDHVDGIRDEAVGVAGHQAHLDELLAEREISGSWAGVEVVPVGLGCALQPEGVPEDVPVLLGDQWFVR
jgi:hypothetical protein